MTHNLCAGCRTLSAEETIAHLGGRGLSGALVYTGTHKVECSQTELRLYVNGKPGWRYVVSVTVNGSDLYDAELWALRGRTKRSIGKRGDLYFDDLQSAVEQLYDVAMQETNGGFIPLR